MLDYFLKDISQFQLLFKCILLYTCTGRHTNPENQYSEGTANSGLPSKYNSMIYRAYHSGSIDGGSSDDDFKASNREEDLLVPPPQKEWLPVNRPSGHRTKYG